MEMEAGANHCISCGEPLPLNGVCAACAFGAALLAGGDAEDDAGSWLGTSDTPQFRLPARREMPARFGGYELRREIAAGGMGIVYEAWHFQARRTVALKMIRALEMASATDVARFKLEAEAAAQLDHPNIVPIHEIGECDDQPFFTMKLVDGGSLAARLSRGKSIPMREAAQLMEKIARAVHHAHLRGVLHRDLKPGNILIDAAGTPFLTDFGLARISDVESGLTLSSAQLGTPHYMSPEQAAGRMREVSTASEIWSLGVILYQMISGRLPFPGRSGAEVMRRILEDEPPSLAAASERGADPEAVAPAPLPVHPDKDMVTIIARCLEKDPARRLNDAALLADELARWLAGEPIRLRPVTGAERVVRWCRRHPARVAAIAAVSLSVMAGSVSSFLLWRRAEHSAEEARHARDAAAEDACFATVANALNERSRFDFAAARKLLKAIPPDRRGFEWRLVSGLCEGDDWWSVPLPAPGAALLATDPSSSRIWMLAENRRLYEVSPQDGRLEPAELVPGLPDEPGTTRRFAGIHRFAIAPDGEHFMTCEGSAVMIVNRRTGKTAVHTVTTRAEAAWLDSGRVIFGGHSKFRVPAGEPAVWIYDVGNDERIPLPPEPVAGPFAVSSDGKRVAWVKAGSDKFRIAVRPVEKLNDPASDKIMSEEGTPVSGMEFSGDGKSLAVAWNRHPAGSAVIFDLETGKETARMPVTPFATVGCLPGSSGAAIVGQNPWITILNPDVSSDGSLWDDGNEGRGEFIDSARPLRPPAQMLTRSAGNHRMEMLFGHEAMPRSLVCLPAEEGLITAADDGTLRRWPIRSAVPLRQRVTGIATLHNWFHPSASPDGSRVAARNTSDHWIVWRASDGRRVGFTPNRAVIACYDDGTALVRDAAAHRISCWQTDIEQPAMIWDAPCGASIQGFRHIIHSSMSADGRRVAVLMPGKFLVVDTASRTVRETGDQQMDYNTTPGQCIAISPDGTRVAVTGFAGRRARLYSADAPESGNTPVKPALPLETYDTACAFSADGTRLFAASEDGHVRVYDASAGRELPDESWKAHTTAVTAMTVSRSGEIVATAAEGALALWTAAPRQGEMRRERLRLSLESACNWIHFASGDSALLHSAPGRPVEIWPAAGN